MRGLTLGFLVILATGAIATEEMADIICDVNTDGYSTVNPIGTCACDGHLYVGVDCTEGYYCIDTSGKGCYKRCASDEFLIVDIKAQMWKCEKNGPIQPLESDEVYESELDLSEFGIATTVLEDRRLTKCPVGGFNVCPSQSGTAAPAPDPNDVDSNPLGVCRCNGELWVSEGCSYGFFCDDTAPSKGGYYKTCPEGQVLLVDFETNEWLCSDDVLRCPGGQISGIGCKQPLCTFDKNPFGSCDCETQFFIGDDCSEAFYCSSNIPDPYLYDGCHQTCLNGQVVLVDAVKKTWECVDRTDYPNYRCPGSFNLRCPDDDIGHDFTYEDCTCDGELLLSGDCKEAFYCYSRMANGGRDVRCEEGQTIAVDLVNLRVYCTEDDGSCPGLGGMRVGCSTGNEVEPPTLECEFGDNNIDTCGCEGQLMVNEDCTEAFYCSYFAEDNKDGCLLSCEGGQIVYIDPAKKEWRCRDRPENFICPGKFKVDCPKSDGSEWDIQCNCKYEIWMNKDCNQAFRCYKEQAEDGSNQGAYARCPAGKVIDIDWENAYKFTCTEELDKCPGSFHFGCQGGDIPDLTTSTTTVSTTTPKSTSTTTNGGSGDTTSTQGSGGDTTTTTQGSGGDTTSTQGSNDGSSTTQGSGGDSTVDPTDGSSSLIASAVVVAAASFFLFVSA